jgi:hypothetical protein
MFIYLSGAIEYAPLGGTSWRTAITPALEASGHEVYDPALDDEKNLTDEEVRNFRTWKTTDLPRFQETMRQIINYDLDIIEERADAVLAYWDEYATRGAGSHGELTLARRRSIPVYLVLGMPVEQVSGWILGCATEIFSNFAEAEQFFRSQHRELAGAAVAQVGLAQ